MSLNSGLSDFSQVGKFVTVYPRSIDDAVALAGELHNATRGLVGPRIPFDAHYRRNSLIYYRYGAFRASAKKGSWVVRGGTGKLYRDHRGPGKAVPRWLSDPFTKARHKRTQLKGPIGVDLLAFKAKMQRGKGGVYDAVDLTVSPARVVIIKEGRRHGETDWNGKDGYARVKHEARVLRCLRNAGLPVPQILREFVQNGKHYLVLEKIAARPLLPRNRVQPARISWRRAMKLLNGLGPLLHAIHSAGYVWRDCKPEHIFIYRGKVCLIDFEGACRLSETGVLAWGSHDYLPPIYRERFVTRRAGTLEDDYALGVILFQFLSGEFPETNARLRSAVYKRARCPDWLSSRIESLLTF